MLSPVPAPHGTTHVSVNFCKFPEVSSMFNMYRLGANVLPALHHWCNTLLSGAPIAVCRFSCLQLVSTSLAVAPVASCIHSRTHGNGGQRRFRVIPFGCHQTSLDQLSCRPRHLSCHLCPPWHLSSLPRHQGHLFGPLQHFPATLVLYLIVLCIHVRHRPVRSRACCDLRFLAAATSRLAPAM